MEPKCRIAPITATINDFCRISGLSRSLIYRLIADGRLDSCTIGKRRLVKIESYRQLIGDELPTNRQQEKVSARPGVRRVSDFGADIGRDQVSSARGPGAEH